MKISPGDSVGRYHILEPLGEGGMAAVYKAYDTRLEREVAIKFLRTELFGEAVLEQLFKRFEREAKVLARMAHFHIVKIHDYGEHEGAPYLVMEYVPGGTLKARLGRPIPWAEAIELLLPVARALEYAHQRGVLHRDIKPSNVLITEGGEPLLSDFGIAKILEAGESQAITSTGVGIGTPEYMAPEQGLAQPVDGRTDVYALGVVLYEMLTGRKPYTADTPTAVLIKQIHDPLPDPRASVPDLPFEVEKVLLKALAKQPEFRYGSMSEMVKAMENLLKPPAESAETATMAVDWHPPIQPPTGEQQPKEEPLPGEEAAATRMAPAPAKPLDAEEAPPAAVETAPPELSLAGGAAAIPPAVKKARSRWWLAAPFLAIAAVAVGLAIWFNRPEQIEPTPPAPTLPLIQPSPLPTKFPEPTPLPEVQKPLPAKVLKIGVIAPFSGPQAAFGAMVEKGVILAVEQWNQRGGVLGFEIQPIMADGGCMPDPTLNEGNRLMDDEDVRFIIGEVCSRPTIPLAEITNPRGVIQISPSATNPMVTVDENGATRPFTFRTCLADPFQGLVAARFAYENLGARRVLSVFEQDNPYGQDLADVFVRQIADLGAEYIEAVTYAPGQEGYSDILEKIEVIKPDLIYLPAYSEVVNRFIAQARGRGIETPFLGSDGWDSAELDYGIAAGSYFTSHYWVDEPRPVVIDFRDGFGARFKDEQGNPLRPDAFAALSYDAVNLLLQAIFDAGTTDTEAVRASLERIDFPGVTGTIHFNAQHNPIKSTVILRVTPEGLVFERLVKP